MPLQSELYQKSPVKVAIYHTDGTANHGIKVLPWKTTDGRIRNFKKTINIIENYRGTPIQLAQYWDQQGNLLGEYNRNGDGKFTWYQNLGL